MTLISVYNSEGCVGRCDARCYGATHGECDCVCGGRNHGRGEKQALANTAAHAERWVAEFVRRTGVALKVFQLGEAVEQLRLFGEVSDGR
jgi:hypothetical protein